MRYNTNIIVYNNNNRVIIVDNQNTLLMTSVRPARHQRVINPAVAMLEVLGKVNKPHAKVNKAHAAVDPEYLRGKW